MSDKSIILPIAMKVGSKDAAESAASFALLFVKNYAILELSDKISARGWWIPKCYFFTALKSDNAHVLVLMYVHVQVLLVFQNTTVSVHVPHVPENTKIPYCRFQNNPQVFIMYLHQQCMYVLFWYLRNTAGSRIDLESKESTFLR